MIFNETEWLRYTRHIQLNEFGAEAQINLKQAKVCIIGMGGLGSPVALYLAAAGVGQLTLIDGDVVDLTNLQRQVIYTTEDINTQKTLAAKKRLLHLNPDITINTYECHLHLENLNHIDADTNLIIDCTDNFSTRYLINDYCVQKKITWIYAGIHQYTGQAALFSPSQACFRCLFPEAPKNIDDCNAAGVIGVLPGLLGLFQANEAIRFLAEKTNALDNTLMLFDAKALTIQKISLRINPECKCQKQISDDSSTMVGSDDYQSETCATNTINLDHDHGEIDPSKFNRDREKIGFITIDVRENSERTGFHIGGTHMPLGSIEGKLNQLDTHATYLCYCQSGKRSATAAKILNEAGLTAYSLSGGLLNWLKTTSI